MAKKKSQGISKSQAVRDYLAEHPGATASVIVPDLAARGIKVSVALVSQVKQRLKQAAETDGQEPASAPAKNPRRRNRRKAGRQESDRNKIYAVHVKSPDGQRSAGSEEAGR